MTTVPALWLKHRRLAGQIACDYYLPGYERQDVVQEAEIALWVACRQFDGSGEFRGFAAMVIRRRLNTCVKMANRKKHEPLNLSARVTIEEDGDVTHIADQLPCLHQVSDRVEDREQLRAVLRAIDRDLSEFERHCVVGLACGLEYVELGEFKSVDNALQRARAKLRAAA
jgi:RNA polymerase sporulation-specific sigma factor